MPQKRPPVVTEEPETKGQVMTRVLDNVRAERVRIAYARTPRPSYDQIAFEVGCTARTVYNIVHGRTHAQP
jgi:hypothetical protein